MTTLSRTAASLVAFSIVAFASVAQADHGHYGHDHVAAMTDDIQSHARQLFTELRQLPPSLPCLPCMYSDATNLYRTASRLKFAAHAGGSISQMHNDVHRLEQFVESLHEEAHHVNGYAGRNLQRLIHCLEDDVQALDRQLVALSRFHSHGHSHSVGYGSSHNHGGIYVGGKNFGIKFGH